MCHKLILNASGNITSIWDSQSSVACWYRSSLPGFFHYKRCSPKKAPCGQNLKTSGILPSSGPGTSAFWLPHQIEFSLGCSADYINKPPLKSISSQSFLQRKTSVPSTITCLHLGMFRVCCNRSYCGKLRTGTSTDSPRRFATTQSTEPAHSNPTGWSQLTAAFFCWSSELAERGRTGCSQPGSTIPTTKVLLSANAGSFWYFVDLAFKKDGRTF